MPLSISRKKPTSLRTSRRRKGQRVLCEAMEERRLMSLTIEVRNADGSATGTATTVGQVLTLNVLAVITDSAHNPMADGLQDADGDFISTAVDGHAVAGSLAATNLSPFKAFGAQAGQQLDLNGDGNLDVGIPLNTTYTAYNSTAGQFSAHSSPIQTGESGTGTISGNTLTFKIATLTYTVTNLNEGGETDINFAPIVANVPETAAWLEDGAQIDNLSGTFQGGTPYVVSDAAIIPAPTAVNYSSTVTKNTATDINELSVDDIITPLNPASVVIGTNVTHGTTHIQADGSVLYTPASGYTGPDSFIYTVADTNGKVSNSATVTINVVNAPPPVAVADASTDIENQPDTISVLTNDTVTSPSTLKASSVTIVTGAAHGTATAQSDGTVLYTPTSGFTGTDTFTYTVTDTNDETSAPGTVTVTIVSPTPPTVPADTDEFTTAGAPLSIDVAALATAGTSPVAPGSIVIVTQPTNGTATANASGMILYTPTNGYVGSDSLSYTIADTLGTVSAQGTLSITVSHAVPPTATSVIAPVLTGTDNTINVLGNVSGGSPLVPGSVAVVAQPLNGHATVNSSTGLITYTPLAGFIGTDTFTYNVGDTALDTSNTATVSVNVGTSISSAKGASHSLTFIDAAGGPETISINVGTAEIYFTFGTGTGSLTTAGTKATVTGSSPELGDVTLTGTTKATALVIKGLPAKGATLGGINDAGVLGSINAPSANVTGNINLGGASSVTLGSITNSTFNVSSGAAKFTLAAGAVSNTTLLSAVVIPSLKVASWTTSAGDSISAPSISRLTVAGAFGPNLILSASGAKTLALSSARITGAVTGGTWNSSGNIGTVFAGSIGSAWSSSLKNVNSFTIKSGGLASNFSAGTIGALSIGGNLTSSIIASSVRSIRIAGGDVSGGIIISGNAGSIAITGAVTSSNIQASGNIQSLSVGSITDSDVLTGGNLSDNNSPLIINIDQVSTANIGAGTLGSFRSGAFASTVVESGKIGAASVGSVTTSNNGNAFGVVTRTLGSVAATFSTGKLRLPHSLLTSEEVLQQAVQQKGIILGDFTVQLLG